MPSETLALPSDALSDACASETYYTVAEAADLLGVSRVTVWRWIRAGHLRVARLGHRTTRIRREDLLHLPVQIDSSAPRRAGRADQSADSSFAEAGDHLVQFYESEEFLVEAIGAFIGAALRADETGIVVASPGRRERVEAALRAAGIDLDALVRSSRYVALDAGETLASIMCDGLPDAERFADRLGRLVTDGRRGGRRVRIYGEMVALLAAADEHAALLRLEQLWNALQRSQPFSLLCGYALDDFEGEALTELLADVCAEHTGVQATERYAALASADERSRVVSLLQQQARSLEVEIAVRKQAEERLRLALEAEQAARQAAEAALRSRDEFLSVASHELRTPVSSLLAQAQLARRRVQRTGEVEPERVMQAMDMIARQADKLARLVNQLLDMSRLESGRLVLEREATPIVPLVERAVEQAQELTERHVITLHLDLDASRPLEAHVDGLRLEQVLTNLLDNAVKYSPDGGPVDVTLARPTPATFEIAVRDHGLGIPPDTRGHVFDRFYQAHVQAQRGGVGLGLYISREIVELHGGTIRPEFPPEGGTRMMVRLPLEPPG